MSRQQAQMERDLVFVRLRSAILDVDEAERKGWTLDYEQLELSRDFLSRILDKAKVMAA